MTTVLGIPARFSGTEPGMVAMGYAARVFSVTLSSSRSRTRVAGFATAFSTTVPKRSVAAKISGSASAERLMILGVL
jgi:hypothetical protein